MGNGERAPTPSPPDGGGFDDAWMEGIRDAVQRLAWPSKLPPERIWTVAQEVAIVLWQRRAGGPPADPAIRRSGDPAIRRSDPAIPDDLDRIILSEIRKELRAKNPEQELPFDVEAGDSDRRRIESAHDPSRPILCARLDALARGGARPVEFRRLILKACAILVGDFAEPGRRGRKRPIEPVWLFRRAYLDERSCAEIASRTGHPARSVVEILRRLSAQLEVALLRALFFPPGLLAAILGKKPVTERDREVVHDALRAFVTGEGEETDAGEPIS